MHRRHWLVSFCILVLAAVGLGDVSAQQEEVTLTDRLKAGLKCRRPEEFAFVESVVALVDQQKLSKELVLSTFQWSLRQRPDFPFYYFQYGIRLRAAAVGVDI